VANNTLVTDIKPFLKWAGGKTQLLEEIDANLPKELKEGKIKRYIEPFVGSGAVLFHLLSHYNIENAYILDINPELINVYTVIKNDVEALITILEQKELEFLSKEKDERKEYYYKVRKSFNTDLEKFNFHDYTSDNIKRAAQFIFLNKTCFNGLFRVNKSGQFNVPMGDYKNPTICNAENLRASSQALQKVEIIEGDYTKSAQFVNEDTFVYFDPPYRPLNESSSFTSYSKFDFTDKEQEELARYFKKLDKLNIKLMLSNSDPKNINPNDNFFDNLYSGYKIRRVSAKRSINSKGAKRGQINELLITNY